MRLSISDQSYVESVIREHGLKAAWKGILKEYIKSAGDKFSYILKDPEFINAAPLGANLLSNLSIGEISILYEFALAYNDRKKRKDGGQYFTPDDVSKFLAGHQSLFPRDTVWIDPCSGVGNLSYWLVLQQEDHEDFISKRLFLVDVDPLALLTARVFFTVTFQKQVKDLFNRIESRFIVRDFLTAGDLPRFDAAILNPPYVSGLMKVEFQTAKTRNLYAYFLERTALLAKKGYISITPQTFTSATSFKSLRKLLLDTHKVLDVYCFDNVPDNIFSGVKFGSSNSNKVNSTRAGIIVAREGVKRLNRITPLLRWRTSERAKMFETAHKFLTETVFTEDVFPKISKDLHPLYVTVRSFERKLKDITVNKETEFSLQVPTTPRYFISANKKPINRTSYKTLYFASQKDVDFAYIILNSSYMYWWWRVNDGGMTISETTLLDLPIPESVDLRSAHGLVRQLEKSESKSKVIKINAGKPIENIKHPADLVYLVTSFLFPNEAGFLSETHRNSHLNTLQVSPQQKLIP